MKKLLPLDEAAEKIAGLGVAGLVLIVLIAASPYYVAAAIIWALVALGPGGILGGIITLGIITVTAESLAKWEIGLMAPAVVAALFKQGETREGILNKIDPYPISNNLKLQLREYVDIFSRGLSPEPV